MTLHHLRGFMGAATSTGAAIISAFSTLEPILRIVSLLVGITVGILTGISIVRNWRKK